MAKYLKEKDVIPLDKEIKNLQLEKTVDDVENSIKRREKKAFHEGLRDTAILFGPTFLSLIPAAIFKKPVILVCGGLGSIVSGTVLDIVAVIREQKIIKKGVFANEFEEEFAEFLGDVCEKKIKHPCSEFYSDTLKQFIKEEEKNIESKDEIKFEETVDKIKEKEELKDMLRGKDIYGMQDTMKQIVRDIDAYAIAYKIPPVEIKDAEWEVYFTKSYELFESKDIQDKYCEMMRQISRYAFAKSLLMKHEQVNIYSFIESLGYLENDMISLREINLLKSEILNELDNTKIVSFTKVKRK